MSAVQQATTRITIIAVLCAAIALWIGVDPAAAAGKSRHRTLNDTRSFGSAPVTPAHAIDFFGLVAELDSPGFEPGGDVPFGEARFLVDGQWTAWQPLGQDGAQHEGQFTGSLIAVDHAAAYQVRKLPKGARNWRAAAINTTEGPTEAIPEQSASRMLASNCRSRAEWGADESISKWSKGTDTQVFSKVQIVTVHHTAGSNSLTQDYSATMRAIYSYHVTTNGWSDIAYQYLIDSQGIVYEGRNSGHVSTPCQSEGGDGYDFAHQTGTDLLVSGGHVYAQHGGNVGISLMGCFEDGECTGNTSVPTAAVSALTDLLTMLTGRHALDPQGQVHYVNPVSLATRDLPAISAHRDWLATACPGANLYVQLPAIRAAVGRGLVVPTADAQALTTSQDTPVSFTLSGTDPNDGALTYAVATPPAHGTLTGTAPNLTYTPAVGYVGADRFTFTVSSSSMTSVPAAVDLRVLARAGTMLYLGSTSSGTAGGVSFANEDILTKDLTSGAWSMFFDGSDVGLSSQDVDAFDVRPDGSLLVSFTSAFTLSGLGSVDDSDIVRFTPTSTGPTTAGTWSWYFDGSDVGLSTSDEDVDAFDVLADGRLVVSTTGSASVSGGSAADEDLMAFTPTATGSTTKGSWAMYLDGSAVGLSSSSSEDVNGVSVDATGIRLSTVGSFSVAGLSGDGSDIFTCAAASTTSCSFSMYWDGSANGFSGEVTDSFDLVSP